MNFRICFVWCCMLYWAFSAFMINESSLSKWDPIFWLRSRCFGLTPLFGWSSGSITLSVVVSTVITSSAVAFADPGSSWLALGFGSSGLWCGVPPREPTFTLSNVPRLPQTVCEICLTWRKALLVVVLAAKEQENGIRVRNADYYASGEA